MKKYLICFTLFAVFLSTGSAQNTRVDGNANTKVMGYIDTLTNADTVINTGLDLLYPYNYQIHVQADSLSGGTSATLYIEQRAYGRTNWMPITSVTIDGVQTRPVAITGSVLGGALRYRTVSSGTQSTKVSVDVAHIRKSQ